MDPAQDMSHSGFCFIFFILPNVSVILDECDIIVSLPPYDVNAVTSFGENKVI